MTPSWSEFFAFFSTPYGFTLGCCFVALVASFFYATSGMYTERTYDEETVSEHTLRRLIMAETKKEIL